jgi:hypothetical protein
MAQFLTLDTLRTLTSDQQQFLQAHAAGPLVTPRDLNDATLAGWSCGFDYRDSAGILRHSTH